MDKRSLIFVICFSLSLFAVNVFFNMRREEEANTWKLQEETRLAKEETELTAALKQNEAYTNKGSAKITNQSQGEKFYVLENEYQQLVFSNIGGALAEINLPFETTKDAASPVKKIEVDRIMQDKYPFNAYFPVNPYYTAGMVTHSADERHLGGYYPLLRRTLVKATTEEVLLQPRYYAFNTISSYPEVANLVYEVTSFNEQSITFEAVQQNRRIIKTYSIAQQSKGAPYCIDLTIRVDGDSRGLSLTSGVPDVEMMSGSPTPALKVRLTRNQASEVEKLDFPKEGIPFTVSSIFPDWICNSNGFFGVIMNPVEEIGSGYSTEWVSGETAPSRLLDIDPQYQIYKASQLPGYMTLLPLRPTGGVMHYRIFAGPFADHILKTVDATFTDPATGKNPDYIASQSFHGWFAFISEPFAKLMFVIMKFFYWLTSSWGLSIILLTIFLRLLLYPLNQWSIRSMRRMQKLAPEVTAIQEKHKKEPKKAQMEIMTLYRTRKVNPFMGCFPLLIQMPFLIGMFDLLKSTFDLRGASFIPGWINNLTAPDVVFSWNYPIFFIGTQFHLLPIILGVVMFLQQRYSSTLSKDKSKWTDQQKQQRMMGNVMTIVFAIMFYHFPSGLNIYWLSSMGLGILQQWLSNKYDKKSLEKSSDKKGTTTILPAPSSKRGKKRW
jgi:YidC/Oxa1 family membrane protein insertase